MADVLGRLANAVIWGIAILVVLGELGINLAPLIAGAGVLGIALGFGAQSLVRDFLSGFFMLVEDQFGVGDVIDVGGAVGGPAGGVSGTVEGVSLRTTRLRDVEGVVWHVPNGEIKRVGNKSQQWSRALLDIEVDRDTDVASAIRVIKETADAMWQEEGWRDAILDGARRLGDRGARRAEHEDPARRPDPSARAVAGCAGSPGAHQGGSRPGRDRDAPRDGHVPPRRSAAARRRRRSGRWRGGRPVGSARGVGRFAGRRRKAGACDGAN